MVSHDLIIVGIDVCDWIAVYAEELSFVLPYFKDGKEVILCCDGELR